MKILFAFEYSGVESTAMRERGHLVYSNDIIPTEGDPRFHLLGDAREFLHLGWDMLVAHVPCTEFSGSGSRWRTDHFVAKRGGPLTRWNAKKQREEGGYWHDGAAKRELQRIDFELVKAVIDAPVERIAIENPISELSSLWRPPDQIVDMWWFGDMEQKRTCWWLKNLPPLRKTNDVYEEMMKLPKERRERIHHMPPGPNRKKERSRAFRGMSDAMAAQWGSL